MVVVDFKYGSYIMDADKAIQIAELLCTAERYEKNYIPDKERVDPDVDYSHHVWSDDSVVGLQVISDHIYRAAKLAGKRSR